MKKTGETAVTLVELLVTVFLLTTAILGALLFFTSAMFASQYAKDSTLVTAHADLLMEEMLSRPTWGNITGTNWPVWYNQWKTTLPNETALANETINVSYTDIPPDLHEISIGMQWTSKTRPMSETFVTRMKK